MTLLSRRAAITAMCLAGLAMRFGRRPVVAQSGVDWLGGGVARDHSGAVVNVFGLEPTLAHDVLQPATKDTPLPDGYAPTDLIDPGALGIRSAGAQLIRKLITQDTSALIDAAAADGAMLYVGSGFRSQSYQAAVFAA